MRYEVLTVVKMSMLVFWVERHVDLWVDSDVTEMHVVHTFSTEMGNGYLEDRQGNRRITLGGYYGNRL
jgi:hypothetical protein